MEGGRELGTKEPLRAGEQKLVLAVVLLLSYPIQASPVMKLADGPCGSLWPLGRAAIVALTCSASYLIPDMEAMVGLTGAFAFSLVGFVLPGLFFLRLRPPVPGAPGASLAGESVLACAMVVLGVVGGVWGVFTELSKVGGR